MKKMIHTDKAPLAIGTYSQAVQVGKTIYFSGQVPLEPKTMTLVSENFREQANQVMLNLQAVSEAANGSLSAIVKLNIYLTDLACFPIVNEVMAEFFQPPYPARTTIQAAALPKGAQIEVDAVMYLE